MDHLINLTSRHRDEIMAHLLSLHADDRIERFTGSINDDSVRRYVTSIGFARDLLVGVRQGSGLVGLAHAAVDLERGDLVCEVGISVDRAARRRGVGKRLLLAAMAATRRFNVRRVTVLFRSSNTAMAALARSIGGHVERTGGDSCAVFDLRAGPQLPLQMIRDVQAGEFLLAIHPRERGRVLLVHGAGGDSYQWVPQLLPALWAAGYSVCAPTLPGHGKSSSPGLAHLGVLEACVTRNVEHFAPTLIVGHSLGGYLVQCHLQRQPARRALLLASVPPLVPTTQELGEMVAELQCEDSRAVAKLVLNRAPDIDVAAVARTPLTVLGGTRDRVIPMPWIRYTAGRYGVAPQFVNGGHRLMLGRAASQVMQAVSA